MPRSFELSADYQGSVKVLYQAFSAEEYWHARLAHIPVDEAKLELMQVGGESGRDGTIDVVTLQVVRSHNLPGLVTQLHRGDLCIRRRETWSPVTDGVATASIEGSIVGAPVNVWGAAELAPTPQGGARLAFRINVHVRAPIIGGKVESIIGTRLAELVDAEQRFTSEWIADDA